MENLWESETFRGRFYISAQYTGFHFRLRHLSYASFLVYFSLLPQTSSFSPQRLVKGELPWERALHVDIVSCRGATFPSGLCVPGLQARRSGFDIEGASGPFMVPIPQTGVARTLNLSQELFPDRRQHRNETRGDKQEGDERAENEWHEQQRKQVKCSKCMTEKEKSCVKRFLSQCNVSPCI